MPYDESLILRIREILDDYDGVTEQKMFGGTSFMLHGNFACGLTKNDLVVRVGPERYMEALSHPHSREMDFTGRPMRGWVYVAPEGYESEEDLTDWIGQGIDFALSLPPK